MDRESIKDYVNKYKNSYAESDIRNQLLASGVTEEEINWVYQSLSEDEVSKQSVGGSENLKKRKGTPALILVLLGIFFFWFPIVNFVLTIFGVIAGFWFRSKNKEDHIALVAIILGIVFFLLLLLGTIFALVVFQAEFNDFKDELAANVQGQQGVVYTPKVENLTNSDELKQVELKKIIKIERLEVENPNESGTVYLKNLESENFKISTLTVSDCNDVNDIIMLGPNDTQEGSAQGINEVKIGGCDDLQEGSAYSVTLVTEFGEISGEFIAR